MKKIFILGALSLALASCAKVPVKSEIESMAAKNISAPAADKAGIYIYRKSILGAALKKDIWIDGKCLGQTAPKVFFYKEVEGNQNHTFSTLSEFSPNHLTLHTKGGQNYFIEQKIKVGAFVGGAKLVEVNSQIGAQDIQGLNAAQPGNCRRPAP